MSKPRPPKSVRTKQQFITVAKLKRLTKYPELVEFHDANSREPELLLELKSMKNTVPIPQHWCQKRRYLGGKRERQPYRLPSYIEDTGVGRLRQAYMDREEDMKMKQKMREKMRPKLSGTIDYQVLYDAFFKHQTKGKMSPFGDLYYEGKEDCEWVGTPGELSYDLRKALGLTESGVPPWFSSMQKFGPPPAYRDIFKSMNQMPKKKAEKTTKLWVPKSISFGEKTITTKELQQTGKEYLYAKYGQIRIVTSEKNTRRNNEAEMMAGLVQQLELFNYTLNSKKLSPQSMNERKTQPYIRITSISCGNGMCWKLNDLMKIGGDFSMCCDHVGTQKITQETIATVFQQQDNLSDQNQMMSRSSPNHSLELSSLYPQSPISSTNEQIQYAEQSVCNNNMEQMFYLNENLEYVPINFQQDGYYYIEQNNTISFICFNDNCTVIYENDVCSALYGCGGLNSKVFAKIEVLVKYDKLLGNSAFGCIDYNQYLN
ncbi:hypothetical protein QTN25_000875 [Entamoeba marina]